MPNGKPNILVIWGDDIGMWNVGAYTHGMMGDTPNIDRIAKEGMLFTDHYGQPSCTAGRAAFITGQIPLRSGMTTIGIPGSALGLQKEDPTLAEVLKEAGYKTGQFGKNHLGDRNEFLPTVHGFDEWFGNLYHLNAEEEPEQLDYPGQKDPEYKKKYAPRGVMHAWATDVDDDTEDGVFGRRGKQKVENTGPLTRKRMETFDGEVLDKTLDWLGRNKDGPFFCWFNTTAIHIWSHPQQKYKQMAADEGRAEEDVVRAKMLEHDEQIGVLLKWLDDNNLTDDTIVIYSTDNGNELMMWPDGGYAPFRGEKGTTWEGGVRVPMLARWPGTIPAGSKSNALQSHEDVYVTLAAAAGLTDIKEKLLKGTKLGNSEITYKVHLDGFNQMDVWAGKTDVSARNAYFYYDETDLTAVRVGNWKMHIGVKKEGSWWNEKYWPSVPYIFNLRMDPLEKMDPESEEWGYIGRKFVAAKLWAPTAATPYIAAQMKSIMDYPPRQGSDSLSVHKTLEKAMAKLENAGASSN